jgi:hypothetical protein
MSNTHKPSAASQIVKNIQEGRAPTNEQLVQALDDTKTSLESRKDNAPQLDSDGRAAIRHTAQLVDATKDLLANKNAGDHIQNIAAAVAQGPKRLEKARRYVGSEILTDAELETLEEMGEKSAKIGSDLLQLIVSSPEFRDILQSAINIIASISGDIADSVSELAGDVKQVAKDVKAGARDAKAAPTPKRAGEAAKDKVQQIGEKVKDKAQQAGDKIKEAVQDPTSVLPEDQLNDLFDKFRALADKVGKNPQYKRAINNLFRLAKRAKETALKAADRAQEIAENLDFDEQADTILEESKALAEEFLPGDMTLDPLIDRIKRLVSRIAHNQELQQLMNDAKNYISEALEDPRKLEVEDFRNEAKDMFKRGRDLFGRRQMKRQIRLIVTEWNQVLNGFRQDDELNAVNRALKKLAGDLTITDAKGRTTLDLRVLDQIRSILLPAVMEQLQNIPIPAMSGGDDTVDWTARDITLNAYEILPDHVLIDSAMRTDIAVGDATAHTKTRGHLLVKIEDVKTKMENIKFSFHRKVFPQITDAGLIDVDIRGGVTVVIRLNMVTEEKGINFTGASVHCRVDDVHVKLRGTKHDIFYNVFPGMFANPIQERMEQTIADNLAQYIGKFKDQLNKAFNTSFDNIASAASAIVDTASAGLSKTADAVSKTADAARHMADQAAKTVKQS